MSKLCFLHRHIRTKDKYYMPMVFSEAIFVLFSHGALSFRSPCFLWIDITGKPCGSFIIFGPVCVQIFITKCIINTWVICLHYLVSHKERFHSLEMHRNVWSVWMFVVTWYWISIILWYCWFCRRRSEVSGESLIVVEFSPSCVPLLKSETTQPNAYTTFLDFHC